jgi:hypothetical protein
MSITNNMIKGKSVRYHISETATLMFKSLMKSVIDRSWTSQQYEKSNNAAQENDKHDAVFKRRNHKKYKIKNLIYIKITYLY